MLWDVFKYNNNVIIFITHFVEVSVGYTQAFCAKSIVSSVLKAYITTIYNNRAVLAFSAGHIRQHFPWQLRWA